MTAGNQPPPGGGFNIPATVRPEREGFTLCQEVGVVGYAVRDTRAAMIQHRDAALDAALAPLLAEKHRWFFWRKRFSSRTDALIHCETTNNAAWATALRYRDDDFSKLEDIEDRVSAAEMRSELTGVILPNSEFNIIQANYKRLGGTFADGTRHVVAAAEELKRKLSAKKPKTQRPVAKQNIVAARRRNLDLDE